MLYRLVNFMLLGCLIMLLSIWLYAFNLNKNSLPEYHSKISFSFTISGFINHVEQKQLYAGLAANNLNDEDAQWKINDALNGLEELVFLQCKLEENNQIGINNLTEIPLFIGYLHHTKFEVSTSYTQTVSHGNYGIYCLLEYKGHQYAATTTHEIHDSKQYIHLVLRPVIGPVVITPSHIKKLAFYKKKQGIGFNNNPWNLIRFGVDDKRLYQGNPEFTHSEFYVNPKLVNGQTPRFHNKDHGLRAQINQKLD